MCSKLDLNGGRGARWTAPSSARSRTQDRVPKIAYPTANYQSTQKSHRLFIAERNRREEFAPQKQLIDVAAEMHALGR